MTKPSDPPVPAVSLWLVYWPADGDWDHFPTLLGVYTEEVTSARAVEIGGPSTRVLRVTANTALDQTRYFGV